MVESNHGTQSPESAFHPRRWAFITSILYLISYLWTSGPATLLALAYQGRNLLHTAEVVMLGAQNVRVGQDVFYMIMWIEASLSTLMYVAATAMAATGVNRASGRWRIAFVCLLCIALLVLIVSLARISSTITIVR